jgi:hypothetical protein
MGPWHETPESKRVALRVVTLPGFPADLTRLGRVWGTPTFWVVKDGRLVGAFYSFRNKLQWWQQFRELLAKAEGGTDAVRR